MQIFKKQVFHKILLPLLSIISLSCSRSDGVTPATASYISFKLNGVLWKSDLGKGVIVSGAYTANGATTAGTVKDAIAIIVEGATATGTYKLESFDLGFAFSKANGSVGYNIGKTVKGSLGTLIITQTKTVSGFNYANATFSGTAIGTDKSTASITEGVIYNAEVN